MTADAAPSRSTASTRSAAWTSISPAATPIRPHLLTTAIGHGRIAAETIDHFLGGALEDKRPKVDVHQFNLLEELHTRHLDPAPYDHTQTRGTAAAKFAIHNYEDRGATQIIPHTALYKGHFTYVARSSRDERHVDADHVLGDFEERIVGFSEEQAQKEGKRCMSCGMCFECDNCVIYLPADGGVARAEKGARDRPLCLDRLHEMHRLSHLRGCLPDRLHPDGPWGVDARLSNILVAVLLLVGAALRFRGGSPARSCASSPGGASGAGRTPVRTRRKARATIASPTPPSCAAITC